MMISLSTLTILLLLSSVFSMDCENIHSRASLLQISILLDIGHLELLKGECAALQFVGSGPQINASRFRWGGGKISEYEQVMEKQGVGCQFSEQHWHSLTEGSLTEACGLIWVSQIANDSRQLNSRERKSKKEEICGFQTKP